MLRTRTLCAFLAVSLLVCLPGISRAADGKGPESAVLMLQKAIEESDTALMEKHVDLSGIAQKSAIFAVEKLQQDQSLRKEAQKSPVLAFAVMTLETKGAPEALAAMLAFEADNFVRYGVASGAFAGKPENERAPGDPGLLFKPLFKGDERDRKRFDGVTVLEQSTTKARLAATLYDDSTAIPLELSAERTNGLWRITDVLNKEALAAKRK